MDGASLLEKPVMITLPLITAVQQCGKADRFYGIVFTASGMVVTVRDNHGEMIAQTWGDDRACVYKRTGGQEQHFTA